HPEPGSNSSLYYCCTLSFSCLGLRYDSLVPYSRNVQPHGSRLGLMLASSFQRTSALLPHCLSSGAKTAAKVQPFSLRASFFTTFFQKFFFILIINVL
ncbi:MAG: hypothetical protein J6P73_09360, partial [Bacteroidales bacterium]|nr:hypothetical protein [Bacteroidales bacterium]